MEEGCEFDPVLEGMSLSARFIILHLDLCTHFIGKFMQVIYLPEGPSSSTFTHPCDMQHQPVTCLPDRVFI